jgi:hypothetical protein
MRSTKKTIAPLFALFLALAFTAPPAHGRDGGYDQIVNHLKSRYQAKKVNIPFMWLARMAVRVVRPAGVKSFSLTVFDNLRFSRETLDQEMQAAMRNSLEKDWRSILRVRSREQEQVYMYTRESGDDIKVMLVTIDKDEAVVIRAKFDPEKFAEFISDPKLFGISIDDRERQRPGESQKARGN